MTHAHDRYFRLLLRAREYPLEPMKNRVFYGSAVLQMLDDNSLEQMRSDVRVPDSLGVNDDDRTAAADAEARRFASLHAIRPEEEILAVQQLRESRIQLTTATIGRAEIPGADENVV